MDAGWNSQQAVNNIEKLVDGLGLDLFTEVVDWPEMRDLQLAFFKAQVPHLDTRRTTPSSLGSTTSRPSTTPSTS